MGLRVLEVLKISLLRGYRYTENIHTKKHNYKIRYSKDKVTSGPY
jgi:hypothetical protein